RDTPAMELPVTVRHTSFFYRSTTVTTACTTRTPPPTTKSRCVGKKFRDYSLQVTPTSYEVAPTSPPSKRFAERFSKKHNNTIHTPCLAAILRRQRITVPSTTP